MQKLNNWVACFSSFSAPKDFSHGLWSKTYFYFLNNQNVGWKMISFENNDFWNKWQEVNSLFVKKRWTGGFEHGSSNGNRLLFIKSTFTHIQLFYTRPLQRSFVGVPHASTNVSTTAGSIAERSDVARSWSVAISSLVLWSQIRSLSQEFLTWRKVRSNTESCQIDRKVDKSTGVLCLTKKLIMKCEECVIVMDCQVPVAHRPFAFHYATKVTQNLLVVFVMDYAIRVIKMVSTRLRRCCILPLWWQNLVFGPYRSITSDESVMNR